MYYNDYPILCSQAGPAYIYWLQEINLSVYNTSIIQSYAHKQDQEPSTDYRI